MLIELGESTKVLVHLLYMYMVLLSSVCISFLLVRLVIENFIGNLF